MGKFDRLLFILNLLDQGNPCGVADLAEKLGVHRRSVFRYLASLQAAGFPIHFDRERDCYAFAEGFRLKKAVLSADEQLALGLAGTLLVPLGNSFQETLVGLKRKFLNAPEGESLRGRLPFLPSYDVLWGKDLSVLKDMALACIHHQLLLLTYATLHSGELTMRKVEPYYLFFSPEGFWNLRAYCRLREGWRTFALDRVEKCEVADGHFVPRMSPEEGENHLAEGFGTYLDGKPVEVVLRFSKDMRPYLERKRWHPSQESKRLPDGELEVRFVTRGLEAVRHWIFRWIPHVRIIKPQRLRLQVLKDLEAQKKLLLCFKAPGAARSQE